MTLQTSTTPDARDRLGRRVRVLHLHLRGEYFRAIADGTKTHEFRVADTWERRISGREYDEIALYLGYPKRGDESRCIRRPWRGYEVQTITHPHFGSGPVRVLAIRVAAPNEC